MRIIMYVLLIGIVLLGISFALLNPDVVNFNYYIGHRAFPLSLLLVMTFVSGCILGLVVGVFLLIKLKLKNYSITIAIKHRRKRNWQFTCYSTTG